MLRTDETHSQTSVDQILIHKENARGFRWYPTNTSKINYMQVIFNKFNEHLV